MQVRLEGVYPFVEVRTETPSIIHFQDDLRKWIKWTLRNTEWMADKLDAHAIAER